MYPVSSNVTPIGVIDLIYILTQLQTTANVCDFQAGPHKTLGREGGEKPQSLIVEDQDKYEDIQMFDGIRVASLCSSMECY
jgi:hypothetical protein